MSEEFILSGPGGPPSGAPPETWTALKSEWVGADGSRWDLNDWRGGVLLDRRGVEGLHEPVLTKFKSRSRAVPGARLRGWRAEERPVFWPVYLWGSDSLEWVSRYRRFFRSIDPATPGVWRVTGPDGEARELELTGVFNGGHVDEVDPVQRGWQQYTVELEAVQPFWQGALIERGPWKAPGGGAPFFPGPPFTISSSAAFGSAFVPNPGDVLGYGTWWAVGPLTSIELGVGDAVISVPFNVADGETLRIITDPRRPSATLGDTPPIGTRGPAFSQFTGVSKTRELGLQRWAGVPPGLAVPLSVSATGAGEIRYHLRPLYRRAI